MYVVPRGLGITAEEGVRTRAEWRPECQWASPGSPAAVACAALAPPTAWTPTGGTYVAPTQAPRTVYGERAAPTSEQTTGGAAALTFDPFSFAPRALPAFAPATSGEGIEPEMFADMGPERGFAEPGLVSEAPVMPVPWLLVIAASAGIFFLLGGRRRKRRR